MKYYKKTCFILLCVMILISGCTDQKEEKQEVLLCQSNNGKVAFHFDENKKINGIYYEDIFDFDVYYTKEEIEEFKTYNFMIPKIIEEQMLECNDLNYSCNSSYDNYLIKNEIYVDNISEAKDANLEEYFGINYADVQAEIIANDDVSCQMVMDDDEYVVKENKTQITIDGKVYESIEDMNYEINKEPYLKEYTLVEIDDKKATIKFQENGLCVINFKEFDSDIWSSKTYCGKNQRIMSKTTYINGQCSYTVKDDYYFDINYLGQYETGNYCEGKEDSANMLTYNLIDNKDQLIQIRFDDNYSDFEFLNGYFRKKYDSFGPVIFKRK